MMNTKRAMVDMMPFVKLTAKWNDEIAKETDYVVASKLRAHVIELCELISQTIKIETEKMS